MNDAIEAAGAAVTAGVAASTLEARDPPQAVGREHCANCGETLKGRFCHACGQAGHVHRSLFHVVEEALHGILHFDGRAVRTLPMLAFRPGTLTGDYIFGMRARFISPIALFLFVVFLMFFVFSLTGGVGDAQFGRQPTANLERERAKARAELTESEADLAAERDRLAGLAASASASEPGAMPSQQGAVAGAQGRVVGAQARLKALDTELADRAQRVEKAKVAQQSLQQREAAARAAGELKSAEDYAKTRGVIEQALAHPAGPSPDLQITTDSNGDVDIAVRVNDGEGMQAVFSQIKEANAIGAIQVNTGVPAWDKKIREKLENPELGWYKIQNAAYKFAFLLIPLSLPFVALLFAFKRNVTLYDHTVFVLYSLSFVCLLAMGISLVAMAAPAEAEIAFLALALALPVHMFFQLKGGYGLSWWSALWRTVALLVCAVFCLALFVAAIVLLGLVG